MNTIQEVVARWKSPTPPFFQKLKKIGLVMGAVGTAILTAPVSLPGILVTVSGYVITAGTVLVTISQLAVDPFLFEPEA